MKTKSAIFLALTLLAPPLLEANEDRFWSYYKPHPSNTIGTEEWWQGNAASGDWWGTRNYLEKEKGITFSMTYVNNIAGNPTGGLDQGFTYTDNIAFGVKLDLEKTIGWNGATLTVAATDRNGVSLSQNYIGNQFTVQQVYGGQTIILTDLFLEQKFLDDKVAIKAGRFSSGDDFASSPLYWLYMNNGIDGNPQALPVNGSFSAYPWATWASRLRVDLNPEWVARVGLYQVSDKTFNWSLHGVNFSFEPGDGVMAVSQISWNPEFFKRPVTTSAAAQAKAAVTPSGGKVVFDENKNPVTDLEEMRGLPGHYWFGGYWSSWEYPQFGQSSTATNAYGFYCHADQMVYQESGGSSQGLILWTALVLSPQESISKVPFQWNGGITYQGLLPGRNLDNTVFGLAYGSFSDDYSSAGEAYQGDPASFEMALEWGYRVQMSEFFYVQPNLQYIVQPGGTGSIPNALVLGAQIGVIF